MDRQDFERELERSNVPDYMRGGLRRYIMQGVAPGDFLRCLLSNDLRGTYERADDNNQRCVLDYLKVLYNGAPSEAWGSPDRFRDWVKLGGLDGWEAKAAAEAAEREVAK